jgi:hypothetical protein
MTFIQHIWNELITKRTEARFTEEEVDLLIEVIRKYVNKKATLDD